MPPKKSRKAVAPESGDEPPRKTRRTANEDAGEEGNDTSVEDSTSHTNDKSNGNTEIEHENGESIVQESATLGSDETENAILPNQTLYINNLNDKIHKPTLKQNLYFVFSTYGHIIDIVALKTSKMRGQAHVVFGDINAAQQAMRALQNTRLFGKEMHIDFAKGQSRAVSKVAQSF